MRLSTKIMIKRKPKTLNKYIILFVCSFFFISSVFAQSVSEDIQILSQFSKEAQLAAYRLVEADTAILPEAHSVLLNDNSNLKLVIQLITVLGQIGDASSIGPIIQAAQKNPDNTFIYQNALLTFANIPQTQDTYNFAAAQLNNERPRIMQRTALWYFAKHKDVRAKKWVNKFAIKNTNPDVQDAALVLAAALNDQRAKPIIVDMLRKKQKRGIESNLLLALTEFVKPDEFNRLTSMVDQNTRQYQSMLRRVKFKWGTAQEKSSMAKIMLKARFPEEKRKAIKYLLDQNKGEILKSFINDDKNLPMRAFVRGEIKRNNYKIIANERDVYFQKIKTK